MKFSGATYKNAYRLVCLLIIITVAGIRIHLADIPFERDEGEYAYAGQLILKGDPPYHDVYNMKFPGVYYMYALSFKLFGEGVAAPRYLVLLLQLTSACFIFLLARRAINPLAGWLCSAFFMLLNLSLTISGCQANAEHFLVAFLVPSMFFLYRGMERQSFRDIFFTGVLLTVACIMKQHAFVFAFATALWIIYVQRFKSAGYLLSYIAGGALPALLMCSYLWYAGVWDRFYFLTIQYASEYVGVLNYHHGIYNLNSLNQNFRCSNPVLFWCLFISALGLFLPAQKSKTKIFLILFLIASAIATTPGYYFRGHYFLILVPVLAILITYTAFALTGYFSPQVRNALLACYVAGNAFFFLYCQKEVFFQMSSDEVTECLYKGAPFAAAPKVSAFIKHHSEPGDRICQVGVEPEIFFLSQRRSASGYIYIYPLLEHQKYAASMTEEFIKQSEDSKPAILLYSSKSVFENGSNLDTRLYQWFLNFKNNYKLIAVFHAKADDCSPMSVVDTISPSDTLPQITPQIKVYKRLDAR